MHTSARVDDFGLVRWKLSQSFQNEFRHDSDDFTYSVRSVNRVPATILRVCILKAWLVALQQHLDIERSVRRGGNRKDHILRFGEKYRIFWKGICANRIPYHWKKESAIARWLAFNMDPLSPEAAKGGFIFDNCVRNNMLEKKWVSSAGFEYCVPILRGEKQ